MNHSIVRSSNRAYDHLRELKISYDVFSYASSSVLFELGNTKVLCAVTLTPGVPPFLRGKRTGWLTAEYAMLPTATLTRTSREDLLKRNGRSIEISRLISRALRSVVDLSLLGERTIMIDCDVLQADGGTRSAAITGAFLALKKAVDHWVEQQELPRTIILDEIAAISVGFINGQALLDLDFGEDSSADADYNFVLTKSGTIIEIQGTAERQAVSWSAFDQVKQLAIKGINNLFNYCLENKTIIAQDSIKGAVAIASEKGEKKPLPLFCLKNRIPS
jgi:ribonuclease PH